MNPGVEVPGPRIFPSSASRGNEEKKRKQTKEDSNQNIPEEDILTRGEKRNKNKTKHT
jgi:hypothetical protein